MPKKVDTNQEKIETKEIELTSSTRKSLKKGEEEDEKKVVEDNSPKLFGVATCQLKDENGKVLLEKGEEALIIGETETDWRIKSGWVSKLFILKKYK